jgi:putative ABC transport system permease protein
VTEGAHESDLLSEIREIPGVSGCIANRKTVATVFLTEDMLSVALADLGGPAILRDTNIVPTADGYWVQAPLIILDDESFASYCSDLGIAMPPQSAIVINKIWDNLNSHYREPAYMDFLGEMLSEDLPLYTQAQGTEAAALRIGAYADELPPIREEHQDFSLTMIMDYSAYRIIAPNLPVTETCYTIRTVSEDDIPKVHAVLQEMVAGRPYEVENRIIEAEYNVSARRALYHIIGVLCGMLAVIGLANVFSNTLGSLYQRRREFARYISVGLTPQGVKRVFFFEGLMVSLQPILLSLPAALALLALFLNTSRLELAIYLSRMPIVPIAVFMALLCASVALAYALGYRTLVLKGDIVDVLKDDTAL